MDKYQNNPAQEEDIEIDADINKYQEINEAEGEVKIETHEQGGEENFDQKDLDYIKSNKTWDSFKLPDDLMNNLLSHGYKYPSKIQGSVIGLYQKNLKHDIIAQSQNGSGKTLSFLIPTILEVRRTLENGQGVRESNVPNPIVIIIADTKELCYQTHKILNMIKTNDVIAQVSLKETEEDIKNEANVIITTVGTLMFDLNKRKMGLDNLKLFILDETDKLFSQDQGRNKLSVLFKRISDKNKDAILGMFSATFPAKCYDIIESLGRKNFNIKVEDTKDLSLKNLTHYYIKCGRRQKLEFMNEFLMRYSVKFFEGLVLIFVNSKKFAQNFALKLAEQGHKCEILTSDMSQEDRKAVMDEFKAGKIRILLTTNLLSRGIDNRKVNLVINLDLPYNMEKIDEKLVKDFDPETYLHRVGRTGRFGDKGIALNVVENEQDYDNLCQLEEQFGINIIQVTTDNFTDVMDKNKVNTSYNTQKREYLEENI